MPMYVAGYYLEFKTVRTIMKGLQIPDRGVEDERLEYPINNWLAENNHLNVRAGAIAHPTRATSNQEDGMLLMTRFIQTYKDDPIVKDVKEDEIRDIQVKKWLASGGSVQLEEFEWVGLWDDYGLTRTGIRPLRNDVKGSRPPRKPLPVTDEDVEAWYQSGGKIGLVDFLLQKEKSKLEAAKSEQPSG